jgi:serine/threonine protein phosphatase PrpC
VSASQNGNIVLSISARTDVGMCRRGNEDCFLVADLSTGNVGLTPEVSTHRVGHKGSLLVVSDGMGGAVAGEIASDLSVKGLREELIRTAGTKSASDWLYGAVEAANRSVFQYAQENPQLAGMGATMTAVLCHAGMAYVAQVGDSRAYLVRGERIKQLTKDQSLVQLLVDAGAIRPDQVDQVPNNVILQALGTRADVVVAMTSIELCRDDHLLLCSDGLSNKVAAEEMRDLVTRSGDDLSGACRRLIELANSRGGEDNITILVASFDGDSLQSATERSSITGSMHALTSDDLLRIGGTQLNYLHDPASDTPREAPDVGSILENLHMTLVPTQPSPVADNSSVTHVAIPALPYQQPAPPEQPRAAAPDQVAPPAGADGSALLNKVLIAIGIVLIGLALVGGIAFGVYWFFFLPRLAP